MGGAAKAFLAARGKAGLLPLSVLRIVIIRHKVTYAET